MNEHTSPLVQETVADEVILGHIRDLIRSYDPLRANRETLVVHVMNGVVRLEGYVSTKRSRRVLMDNIPTMAGVMAVDDKQLYDDETMTMQVAQVLPLGVRTRVENGIVWLMGKAANPADVVMDVAEIAGVDEVRNHLHTN